MISADTLPLRGWETANAGQLLLRSTCWSVSCHRPDKDGATTGKACCGRVGGGGTLTFLHARRDERNREKIGKFIGSSNTKTINIKQLLTILLVVVG